MESAHPLLHLNQDVSYMNVLNNDSNNVAANIRSASNSNNNDSHIATSNNSQINASNNNMRPPAIVCNLSIMSNTLCCDTAT